MYICIYTYTAWNRKTGNSLPASLPPCLSPSPSLPLSLFSSSSPLPLSPCHPVLLCPTRSAFPIPSSYISYSMLDAAAGNCRNATMFCRGGVGAVVGAPMNL